MTLARVAATPQGALPACDTCTAAVGEIALKKTEQAATARGGRGEVPFGTG